MSEMLMKVQIGPVQEFIAQARSTRDMWAGSYLLSRITARAMEVFKDNGDVDFVFPDLKNQSLYEMVTGKSVECDKGLIPTLPNVFMMIVPKKDVSCLAEKAKEAVSIELGWISNACWEWMKSKGAHSDEMEKRWNDHVARFPIINWHAVEYDGIKEHWSETVDLLGKEMAARRNTREFDQWGWELREDPKDKKEKWMFDDSHISATKDVLSGKEESIGSEELWDVLKLTEEFKKSGPYGAINCIKRLFPYCCFPNRKEYWNNLSMFSTRDIAGRNKEGWSSVKDENEERKPKNPYMAVIAMDGDRMGAALKKIDDRTHHEKFSRELARFSEQEVKGIVNKAEGQLVYAGGDDVLVLCPADGALTLAQALHDKFLDVMKDFKNLDPENPIDASCGIAVGHYQFPLQRIVDEARKAESRAKNKRGRAAFALTLLKRSGEIIHWGAKWESPALEVYNLYTKMASSDEASSRFPYAFAALLAPYRLNEDVSPDFKEVIWKEYLHVRQHQKLVGDSEKQKEMDDLSKEYLDDLFNKEKPGGIPTDFSALFLASAFMNRQRGES